MRDTTIFRLAQSLRPQTMVLPWFMYSAVVLVYRGTAIWYLVAGLLLLILTYGVVVIQNDIADEATDVQNDRADIPLAAGLVSVDQLNTLMIVLSISATILALAFGPAVALWVGISVFLGWVYSGPPNFKSKGLAGLLLLGVCYGVMPWVLAVLALHIRFDWLTLCAATASGIFAAGIVALKDFKDEKGDRHASKKTALVRYGPGFVQAYVQILTTAAYLLLVALAIVSKEYWLGAIAIILAGYSWSLLRNRKLRTSGSVRGVVGNLARLMFYGYCVSTYVLIATR